MTPPPPAAAAIMTIANIKIWQCSITWIDSNKLNDLHDKM
jgi:hypothetical protein